MRPALVVLGLMLGLSLGGVARAETSRAIFASGCFWCTESDFEKLEGVTGVVSGYTGGTLANPKYEQVGRGNTGHTEAVEIIYDPAKISYAKLLDHFWRTHDLFDGDGQFCDQGSMYRPGVFYLDDVQKQAALASRATMQKKFDKPIQTEITQAGKFWPAEEYHQDYYKENSLRYRYYRSGCGRDGRIKEIWESAKP